MAQAKKVATDEMWRPLLIEVVKMHVRRDRKGFYEAMRQAEQALDLHK